MELSPTTKKNLKMWLDGEVDEASKSKILHLLKTQPQEIVDAFYTKLTFGTGGLRGIMGLGSNRMNHYTVRMATQGLANYIKKQSPPLKQPAVFIGYDSRHQSRYFAEEAAKVLAGNDITVFLCSELRPTPLVSFGCRMKHCSAAIMITASHNPPEYNGYKVYWSDGGQVVPPHDNGIIREVDAITDFSEVKIVKDITHPLVVKVGAEIDEAYFQAIKQYQCYPEQNTKHSSLLSVVYTSLHGTGITLVPQTLKKWGFTNIVLVKEQCTPDGNFPTVNTPNPEERHALELGIQTVVKSKADLLIATDPDADRVGVAVMHENNVVTLNGNQIACLCLFHICNALTTQKRMPKNAAFIKTIATTELFKAIAESFGAACFDVLTGFKYVAEKILQWEKEGNNFQYVFGGEESYGYLLGTHARDKDAVICSALICEVALHAKLQGKTLVDLLNDIYRKYGVYYEMLASIEFNETKEGQEQMVNGMREIQNQTPKTLLGTPVKSVEDYQNSVKTDLLTGEKSPLGLPKSNAILLWLEDKTKILIRPSGTEPKIKIYCGVIQKEAADNSKALEECKARASAILHEIKGIFTHD